MKRTVHQAVFDTPEAIRAARLGHAAACAELDKLPRHMLNEGNPNHPMYDAKLFGYDRAEFMAKQYKVKQ